MSKAPIALAIREITGCTILESQAAAKAVFDAIAEALEEDGIVQVMGFGTFRLIRQRERTIKNPRTGVEQHIPTRATVRFRPSPRLRAELGASIDGKEVRTTGRGRVTPGATRSRPQG